MQSFSVLMSVYKKDNDQFFRQALDSILHQTSKPSEIILVIDGPVTNLINKVIDDYSRNYSIINVVRLPQNKGLGNALHIGVVKAKNELIARMDSDDISLPSRFEHQLKCFSNDKKLSIVGGSISEFIGNPDNIVGNRVCPTTDSGIKCYMRSRCGFNHMTVMFKKSEVLRAGNYLDWFCNEDYYLWIRMLLSGCKFANLPETLVNVRVGKEMYARRGGWKYFKSEAGLQKFMLKNKLIRLPKYMYNVIIRFILQIMIPNAFRGFIFRKFARK